MNYNPLYSADDITKTYEKVHDHKLTKNIISLYSTNRVDVRELALSGLDLTGILKVLDLGCGYGLFDEKLKGRLSVHAEITGVDIVESNKENFLKTVTESGYIADFINAEADVIKTFQDGVFDLVIASYSLYFFPHLIREISRILKPEGLFITITHSRESLREVTGLIPDSIRNSGLAVPDEFAITKLLKAFCSEEGYGLLSTNFKRVEMISYNNSMYFLPGNVTDCIEYLNKKRPLLFKDVMGMHPDKVDEVESYFYQCLHEQILKNGSLSITKDDAIFRAFNPIKKER
jgi:ubiquinone/menaquinone biosynthesis C-methylase UbiE